MHPHFQFRKRREQNPGIEVSSDGGPIADVHPSLVDVDAPIYPHDVAARRVQLPEKACRAGAEVNHGNTSRTNSLDESARIGGDVAHVIVRAQRAGPTIEYLDSPCSAGHLA